MKQPIFIVATLSTFNGTLFATPHAYTSSPPTTEARVQCRITRACTWSKMSGTLSVAPGGSASRTITLRKNNSDTALTLSFGSGDTVQSDLVNSVSFAVGDTLTIECVGASSPAGCNLVLTFIQEIVSDTISQYGFGGGSSSNLGTGATPIYTALFASAAGWSTTQVNGKTVIGVDGNIIEYGVVLSAAPGAGKSRTFTLQYDDVDQDGTSGTPDTRLTISESATTGSVTFTLPVLKTHYITLKEVASGTPADAYCGGTLVFQATVPGQMQFCGVPNDAVASNGTEYTNITGMAFDATEGNRQLTPSVAIELSGLYVILRSAVGGGHSLTYTLRKNNSDTGHSVALTSGETTEGPSTGAKVAISTSDNFSVKGVSVTANIVPHFAFVLTDPTVSGRGSKGGGKGGGPGVNRIQPEGATLLFIGNPSINA